MDSAETFYVVYRLHVPECQDRQPGVPEFSDALLVTRSMAMAALIKRLIHNKIVVETAMQCLPRLFTEERRYGTHSMLFVCGCDSPRVDVKELHMTPAALEDRLMMHPLATDVLCLATCAQYHAGYDMRWLGEEWLSACLTGVEPVAPSLPVLEYLIDTHRALARQTEELSDLRMQNTDLKGRLLAAQSALTFNRFALERARMQVTAQALPPVDALPQERACPSCSIAERGVALSCGHIVCQGCSARILAAATPRCDLCRAEVTSSLKVYI